MKQPPMNPNDDDFDDEIVRSLLRSGAAFPMTPDEVRAAKKRLVESPHQLPKRLEDAAEVCKKIVSGEMKAPENIVFLPLNEFAEAKEELKRAARNGKEMLSSRVEEKMRANRQRSKVSNG